MQFNGFGTRGFLGLFIAAALIYVPAASASSVLERCLSLHAALRLRHSSGGWSSEPNEISRIQKLWEPEHFTDPRRHNPSHFQYLVKAVRGSVTLNTVETAASQFNQAEAFSASLVSDKFAGVLGGWGFIVRPGKDRVIATASFDMGSYSIEPSKLQADYDLHTPTALIEECVSLYGHYSGDAIWNEIKLIGNGNAQARSTNRSEITGMFASASSSIAAHDSSFLERVREIAAAAHLPFVLLP